MIPKEFLQRMLKTVSKGSRVIFTAFRLVFFYANINFLDLFLN